MQIRDLIAMIFVVVLVLLLVNCGPQIAATLTSMGRIGPGHSTDEKVTGLVALGLIGAVLVAVVKILSNRNVK
jgi:hypothetical protein